MNLNETVYYSALINNHDSKTSNASTLSEPHLTFNEIRDNPIIKNCQDYKLAIINFKLDTKSLPVFIPVIEYDGSGKNKSTTIYTVFFEYLGYSGFQNVLFKPQDETIDRPIMKNGYADYSNGYYNYYNYEPFLTDVNRAVVDAFNQLEYSINMQEEGQDIKNDFNIFKNAAGKFEVPQFIYDKDTKLIFMNAPKRQFNDDIANGNFIKIFLNEPLYRLFNSLPFKKQHIPFKFYSSETKLLTNTNPFVVFRLNLNNFKNSNEIEIYPKLDDNTVSTTKSTHLIIYQDYETLSSWSPVDSIVFTSNSIPVRSTVVSANHSYDNGVETTEGSSNSIALEICEFRAGLFTPGVIYEPSVLRWIDMYDQDELCRININIYYKLKYTGQLIPFRINNGGSFSIKMAFQKIK
jgi:hypothetical protein